MGMKIRKWKMNDCIGVEDTPEFWNTAEHSGAALHWRYSIEALARTMYATNREAIMEEALFALVLREELATAKLIARIVSM